MSQEIFIEENNKGTFALRLNPTKTQLSFLLGVCLIFGLIL